ncbi:hypothetical protein ACQP2T_31370 [Nonomuraea sp. CA-143628]|uniref:hypothetical protein n=1 Tax=Nonomuraea sp. CA-143628 TaxID=3239997 RepID=UPI003D92740B
MTAQNRTATVLLTIAASTFALTGAACSAGTEPEAGTASPGSPSSTPSSPPSAPARGGSQYRDGAYIATGTYGGGPSHITVTLTLDDDVITRVAVAPHATNPTSRDYQERFATAVPQTVVGRDIDDVRLSRTAGSSGTPVGFNDALEQIKSQAAN